MEEAAGAIARELNGPVTALMLYMTSSSDSVTSSRPTCSGSSTTPLQQTERVYARVKQLSDGQVAPVQLQDEPEVILAPTPVHKPLTRREREGSRSHQ